MPFEPDTSPMSRWLHAHHRAPMPEWLARLSVDAFPQEAAGAGQRREAAKHLVRAFLDSRTFFYPGSRFDGSPVAIFNSARACACFVYVDYMVQRQELVDELARQAFRHYRCILHVELEAADFPPWTPHAQPGNARPCLSHQPYGFVRIFEREPGVEEKYGYLRFAVMFLSADGHAAYDALYCQDNGTPAPFCFLAEDTGFNGNYSSWGRNGVVASIAAAQGVLPDLMLRMIDTSLWDGYEPFAICREQRSRFMRCLHRREGFGPGAARRRAGDASARWRVE